MTPEPAIWPMVMPDASSPDGCGRGLSLTDELSSRRGVQPAQVGKTVWFEIDGDFPLTREDNAMRDSPALRGQHRRGARRLPVIVRA